MTISYSNSMISIHALREEGDNVTTLNYPRIIEFLSTPSARRATSDAGESGVALGEFLSTPSARRATRLLGFRIVLFLISIHALREEGDQSRPIRLSGCPYFYPRPPRGGRRNKAASRVEF